MGTCGEVSNSDPTSRWVAWATANAAAGAARAGEHLVQIVGEAEGMVVRSSVLIGKVTEVTDVALQVMLDDLAWWAKALKAARDPGQLRFRQLLAEARATAEAPGRAAG